MEVLSRLRRTGVRIPTLRIKRPSRRGDTAVAPPPYTLMCDTPRRLGVITGLA